MEEEDWGVFECGGGSSWEILVMRSGVRLMGGACGAGDHVWMVGGC